MVLIPVSPVVDDNFVTLNIQYNTVVFCLHFEMYYKLNNLCCKAGFPACNRLWGIIFFKPVPSVKIFGNINIRILKTMQDIMILFDHIWFRILWRFKNVIIYGVFYFNEQSYHLRNIKLPSKNILGEKAMSYHIQVQCFIFSFWLLFDICLDKVF